jgi:hypothetical protein
MLQICLSIALRSLHNRDLFLRQPVQLISQRVDLPALGSDMPLQVRLLMRRAGLGVLFVQGEHLIHQEGGII